jgi:diaminohydroxyphosphoribosylaminopyrimidine deaminase/5-amino-6-(5-phosphoribosylamino)uracil reductase
MNRDIYFLRKTLQLAKKAEGFTSPNPLVGAVIAKKGKVIAQGYHKKAGLAHAEIEALNKAKENLGGATLYVNLEPCCHFGRTGPCVDEIIKRKIKRVVIATLDPNHRVYKKSVKKLRLAGIKVEVGLLEKEARQLNEVFFKNMQKQMPFVAVKLAQSLDGKIATARGESKWITQKRSRLFAKSLRDNYDAVLVGINTVVKDNPRFNGLKKIPYKVIIDPHLRLPKESFLLENNPDKLIIFTSEKSRPKCSKIPKPARIFFLREISGELPLRAMLRILYNLEIRSVFVEGGAQTVGNFFDKALVDKIYLFIAPKIIGGKNSLSAIGGKGFYLNNCPTIKDICVKRIGKDLLICGYPEYGKN